MIELLGILGGFCFAYAGVPGAIATWKAGKSIGIPIFTSWLIFLGTIFLYAYLYLSYGFDWILTINYSIEGISWGIIIKYHYLERK